MFCEKCGGLIIPKNKKLVCSNCGEEGDARYAKSFKLSKRPEKFLIIDEKVDTLPKTRAECPKCGNMKAEWWLIQTRRADEAETRFFRCTKCKFTWREYD
jgi:DNA-directed RNA polymerase subunit M